MWLNNNKKLERSKKNRPFFFFWRKIMYTLYIVFRIGGIYGMER